MSAHKGYATIFVILIFTIPFVLLYVAAWAPWVSLDFARQKALASIDKPCRELKSNEYSDTNPSEIRSLTIGEQLGLAPAFGQAVKLYVLCGETSTKNTYFISFLGSAKLQESIPIPHRVLDEVPQNTIEKINETTSTDQIGTDWKTYRNEDAKFKIMYPPQWKLEFLDKWSGNPDATLVGKEGKIDFIWGDGLGGGCDTDFENIILKNGPVPSCHIVSKTNEVWGLFRPVGVSADTLATVNTPIDANRALILEILKTYESIK